MVINEEQTRAISKILPATFDGTYSSVSAVSESKIPDGRVVNSFWKRCLKMSEKRGKPEQQDEGRNKQLLVWTLSLRLESSSRRRAVQEKTRAFRLLQPPDRYLGHDDGKLEM